MDCGWTFCCNSNNNDKSNNNNCKQESQVSKWSNSSPVFSSVTDVTASVVEFDPLSTKGKLMVCFVKLSSSGIAILLMHQHCKCCGCYLIVHFLFFQLFRTYRFNAPADEVAVCYFKIKTPSASLCCCLTGEGAEAGPVLSQNKTNESTDDFVTLWFCFYSIFPGNWKGLLGLSAMSSSTPAHGFFHSNQRQSYRLFCLLVLLNSVSLCAVSL